MKVRIIYNLENERLWYSPKKQFNMKSAMEYYNANIKDLPNLKSAVIQYFDTWHWRDRRILK